jgi:hypothetical protein
MHYLYTEVHGGLIIEFIHLFYFDSELMYV